MARKKKQRLDTLLVQRGLAPSRARAQSLIMARAVSVNGQTADKAGTQVQANADIRVRTDPNPYVSRGGLKLAGALEAFEYDPSGLVAIDAGASTGGFTDCLLQHGVERVYAVDVGYGQLAWSLRQDPRVVVLERLNARYLTTDHVPEPCDLAVFDLSFISLEKVVPAVLPLLKPTADLIALVKPQFEAQPSQVGKGGVIRDHALRLAIIDDVVRRLTEIGLEERARVDSTVPGPKGNVECLVWFRYSPRG